MPIKADQLKEKEDYQKLILDSLHDNNGFRIRPNTEYKPGLAMDIGMLLEFLESTQHDTMEQLRRMYKERTEETVINYINAEINKTEEKIDGIIHELVYTKFRKYYEQYKVNYKIQLIQFTNEFTSLADFKFVTKHYLNTQATNSLMFITREQVKEIKGNLSILNVLKDIDVQKNFNDKRVLVYCQPVKNIKTGQYDTAEALMRLDIPDMGIITPDKFIALAEQEDLIHSFIKYDYSK